MWGLDFDRDGQLFASTNVGGYVMLHAVQGGNYWKQFDKHGPLRNPYTFGFFDHVAHKGLNGGHVQVGGLFYQADALPERYRGKYFAGDLLDHKATWHALERRGSTFIARQEGDLIRANDTWFAPTDLTLGPDGAVYIADWHDRRTAHPDPDADWDRSNGRIYAILSKAAPRVAAVDYTRATREQLLKALRHPNIWHVRRARRILAERRDPGAFDALRKVLRNQGDPAQALEALWVLASAAEFDESLGLALLAHRDENVRAWSVRLLGDREHLGREASARLVGLGTTEPSVRVRAQLASTAARLEPRAGLTIAANLAFRDLDNDDAHVPLLLWWAVEQHAIDDRATVVDTFSGTSAWKSRLVRTMILPRLIRRYAAEACTEGDTACALLLSSAPTAADRVPLLEALHEGLRGRGRPAAPALLASVLRGCEVAPNDPLLLRVAARLGDRKALERALTIARDSQAGSSERLAMLALFAEVNSPGPCSQLIALAEADKSPAIRIAALDALARRDELDVAEALLRSYLHQGNHWQARARDLLLSRVAWARQFLDSITHGAIRVEDVPLNQVGKIALLGDPELDARVRVLWGTVRAATPEERLAEVRRLNNDLRAAGGDRIHGRVLFQKHCATCHKLFGEGADTGPDLTHANRKDRDYLLVSLVDPSGTIRKEFQAFVAATHGGRVVTGLIAAQDANSVTLVDAKGTRVTLARDKLEDLKESPASLMPEDLYKSLNPAELRDLFSYLQGDGPALGRHSAGGP
jgi:putative heme-binding domain-containing protein